MPEGDVLRRAARPRGRGRRCPGSTSASSDVVSMSTMPGQRAQVEGHAAEERDARPAHPRAPGHGGDRDAGLVTGGQHRGDLGGVGGTGHHGRTGRDRAARGPADGQRPPVASRLGARRRRRRVTSAHTARSRASRASSTGTRGAGDALGDRRRRRVDGVTGVGVAGHGRRCCTGSSPAAGQVGAGPVGERARRRGPPRRGSRPHSGASSSATAGAASAAASGPPQAGCGSGGPGRRRRSWPSRGAPPTPPPPAGGGARPPGVRAARGRPRPAPARPGSRRRGGPPGRRRRRRRRPKRAAAPGPAQLLEPAAPLQGQARGAAPARPGGAPRARVACTTTSTVSSPCAGRW